MLKPEERKVYAAHGIRAHQLVKKIKEEKIWEYSTK